MSIISLLENARACFNALLDVQKCIFCNRSLFTGRTYPRNTPNDTLSDVAELLCKTCCARLPYSAKQWTKIPHSSVLYSETFFYEGDIRSALLRFKFREEKIFAKLFGIIAARKLTSLAYYPKAVIPIPLPDDRKRERGYNQVEEVAKVLVDRLGIELISDLLYKSYPTIPQTEMRTLVDRRKNVQGSFSIKMRPKHRDFQGVPLILLDDVLTSGATVIEASKVLTQHGFRPRVLVIARKNFNKRRK